MVYGGHDEHNHATKRISGFNILHQLFIRKSIHGIDAQKSQLMIRSRLNFLNVRPQHLLLDLINFKTYFLRTRREKQETEDSLPACKRFVAPLKRRVSKTVDKSTN